MPSMFKRRWEKWFAWYPVEVNEDRVWFKFVYRYKQYIRVNGDGISFKSRWVYGDILDVLSHP